MSPTGTADSHPARGRRGVGAIVVANLAWLGSIAALAVAGWVRSEELVLSADADASTSGWLVPAALGVGLVLLVVGIVVATAADPSDRFDPKAVITPVGVAFVAFGAGEIASALSRDAEPKLSSWVYVACGLAAATLAEIVAIRHTLRDNRRGPA